MYVWYTYNLVLFKVLLILCKPLNFKYSSFSIIASAECNVTSSYSHVPTVPDILSLILHVVT